VSRAEAIVATLIVYKLVMIAIGLAANRLAQTEGDYFLGGRQLGPAVAALSASASSSSVWTLIGVSGYAYGSTGSCSRRRCGGSPTRARP
jgi:Na+/proline symporter